MNAGMFLLMFNSPYAQAAPECDELKRDMIALELFLQDKEDKKEKPAFAIPRAPFHSNFSK